MRAIDVLILGLCLPLFVEAQLVRRLQFQSKYDRFELLLKGQSGSVRGKKANLSALHEFLGALTDPLDNSCPDFPAPPDLKVTEDGKTRSVYILRGLVAEGDRCLHVTGNGLYYLPLHRDFLIGPPRGSIPLRSPLIVELNNQLAFHLEKKGSQWVNPNPDFLLDWDFFERFEKSLADHDIDVRLHPQIGVGKPKVTVKTGGQVYEFYKVSDILWAVRRPHRPWLEGSKHWGFWHDFAPKLYTDRFTPEIKQLSKPGPDVQTRRSLMQKLEGSWSRNLRELYHQLLLNPEEDKEVRLIAARRLRSKPSLETAGVFVSTLTSTTDSDLQREAATALKLFYPKGPKLQKGRNESQVIEYWRTWWARQKSSKR